MAEYIHGYSERELIRLREQAQILEPLLHAHVRYPANSRTLEMGCGVGAQTAILARNSPGARFHSVDISAVSLAAAREYVQALGYSNVTFENVDINSRPFPPESFDHVFVCFVLEHLPDPLLTLRYLHSVLRPGGSITLIEGDHGATVWSPSTGASIRVWRAFIQAQLDLGHDPQIGRRLFPLLDRAGFKVASLEPLPIYGDGHSPKTLTDFVDKIIVPMTQTGKEAVLKAGYVDEAVWEEGIKDLAATSKDPANGSFFYTWFKGVGVKEGA